MGGGGGGSDGLSLRFIIFSALHGLSVLCFSVMSDLNLDDPGFQSLGAPTPAPPSSGSSSDTAPDRRTCITCHRWMSKKTFDCHTICVACRGSDCDIDHRCEECTEWPEEELLLYVKHRRTLKSKRSKPKTQAPPPPAAPSVPSSHPAPRSDFESWLELLASQVSALSELLTARLAAPQAIGDFLPASHAPSQTRLESDTRCPHPVETAGHHQESQALGGSGREPDAPVTLPFGQAQLGGDLRASAGLGWALPPSSSSQAPRQPSLAPGGVFVPPLSAAAPSVAAASYPGPRFAPPPPGSAPGGSSAHALPPRFSSAPPRTPRDSGSEDSDSDSSSASAALDSSAAQLAELVYDFCPEERPVSDSAPPPRCGFESWFDPSPASPSISRLPLGRCGRVRGCGPCGCAPPPLQTFVGGFAAQDPPLCGCGSATFCGSAAVEPVVLPPCRRFGRGV